MTETDRDAAAPVVRHPSRRIGDVDARIEGQHSGYYLLGSVLGQGRSGPVVGARREPGSRSTVVWLRPFDAPSAERRVEGELAFLRGAARRTHVRHANLARVLDYGTDGVRGFLVTEPPPGETLAALLAAGPPGPGVTAEIGLAIASALVQLHEAGLAHGAVAPDNVRVGFDLRGSPSTVLVDDGLADADPGAVTRDLEGLGRLLRGMAPMLPLALERLAERLVSPRRQGPPITAFEAVRVFRAFLAATPRSISRSGGPPTIERRPDAGPSDWWWVIGSVTIAVLSLLAVGAGATGVTQSLHTGSQSLIEVAGIRVFGGQIDGVPFEVDGVMFTLDEAARTLGFVNEASEGALLEAGIHAGVVARIVEARPFATIEAFGATRGIGSKSVAAARIGSR